MRNALSRVALAVLLVVTGCAKDSEPAPEGETTNPNVSIRLSRGGVALTAARDRLRFPAVTADGAGGAASPALSVTVTNAGTETLRVYRVERAGGDGADFSIDTAGMAGSVAPSGSTQFRVAFDPLTAGAKQATVLLVTNAGADGRYELIVRGNAGPIPVNAAETATHALTVKTAGDVAVGARSVTAGRVRPDGALRILVGSGQNPGANQGARLTVFEPSAAGAPWGYELESTTMFNLDAFGMYEPILAHDFDGDGVDEILGRLDQAPTFVRWDGTDYVTCWPAESAQLVLQYGAALADVDRDGREELLTGDESETRVYSWGDGFTGFQVEATLPGGSGFNVGVGDLDGDGFLEVATAVGGTGDDVYVHRFDAAAGEWDVLHAGTGLSTIGYSGFSAADLDGDFVDELVGGSPNWTAATYHLSLFEWDGAPWDGSSLVETSLHALGPAKYQVAVGDFDRDGRAEALVDQNGGNSLIVEETGVGIEALDAGFNSYMFLRPRDWDGDGFPELLVGDLGTHSPFVLRDEVTNP